MEEIWKKIKGFETYEVSTLGNIRHKRENGKIITIKQSVRWPQKNAIEQRGKYLGVTLYNHGERKSFSVHRLVAEAFISNPEGLPHVNHKDGIKDNNAASNLEWCTHQQNTQHRWDKLENDPHGSVKQYSKDGTFIRCFASPREASKSLGIERGSIVRCAKGEGSIAGGFVWRFEEDEYQDIRYNNKVKRKVIMLSLWGEKQRVFDSLVDAARFVGVKENNIYCCCNKNSATHRSGGHIWRYLDEHDSSEFAVFDGRGIVEKTKNGVFVRKYRDIQELIETKRYDIIKIKRAIENEHTLAYRRKWELC